MICLTTFIVVAWRCRFFLDEASAPAGPGIVLRSPADAAVASRVQRASDPDAG
jgi:hypothetical protein